MRINSISWFSLLLLGLLSTVASHGEAILDAMSMILFGYVIILVRTGKHHSTSEDGSSVTNQIIHLEWSGLKSIKLGGMVLLFSTGIILLPASWQKLASITFGILAIEIVALLVLECALRHRFLGNLAITVVLIGWSWSVHLCSKALVAFLFAREGVYSSRDSWIVVFDYWYYTFLILVLCMLGLQTVLRLFPNRSGRLAEPRLWLFA